MRIITGEARGKKLLSPEGEAVRPTPDRVKEALFNILQFQIEGRRFLDLFAGSGQIGLEAVSRGAECAVFVDASKKSVNMIEKNIEATGFAERARVYHADSVMFIKHVPQKFDVIFIDPPYKSGLIEKVLPDAAGAVNAGGTVICEHPLDEALPESAGTLIKIKDYRYGKIVLTSYRSGE